MIAGNAVAGSTMTAWIGENGRLTRPPLSRAEVTRDVIRAAIAVPVALALVLAAVGGVVSLLLDGHRLACWGGGLVGGRAAVDAQTVTRSAYGGVSVARR